MSGYSNCHEFFFYFGYAQKQQIYLRRNFPDGWVITKDKENIPGAITLSKGTSKDNLLNYMCQTLPGSLGYSNLCDLTKCSGK